MKKLSKYLLVVIACLLTFNSYSQGETGFSKENKDRYVFWFYIKADIKRAKVTGVPVYSVRILSKKPKSGTLKKFERDLWRNLNGGQNLVIGPFTRYNDAVRAIGLYNLSRKSQEDMEKEIANYRDTTAGNDDFYWFFLKYSITPRKHKFVFERTPARVASGDIKTFKQVLWDGLTFQQLAIGPFAYPFEAEESKHRYRIEEN